MGCRLQDVGRGYLYRKAVMRWLNQRRKLVSQEEQLRIADVLTKVLTERRSFRAKFILSRGEIYVEHQIKLLQSVGVGWKHRRQVATKRIKLLPHVRHLQRVFRGFTARVDFMKFANMLRDKKIRLLQKWARKYKARKWLERNRIARYDRIAQEENLIFGTKSIQRVGRGFLGKMKSKQFKLAELLRGKESDDLEIVWFSAAFLQATGRAYLARKLFAKTKCLEGIKRRQLQRLGRGFIQRKRMYKRYLEIALPRVLRFQRIGRSFMSRESFGVTWAKTEHAARVRAARSIQIAWGRHVRFHDNNSAKREKIAMLQCEDELDTYAVSLSMVQRWCRMVISRQTLRRNRLVSNVLADEELKMERLVHAVAQLQCVGKGWIHRHRLGARLWSIQWWAAQRIQKYYRGHSGRLVAGTMMSSRERNRQNLLREAAIRNGCVTIQSLFKGHQTRQALQRMQLQRMTRWALIEASELNKYRVVKIQSRIRGYLMRKMYKNLKQAKAVCQNHYESRERMMFLIQAILFFETTHGQSQQDMKKVVSGAMTIDQYIIQHFGVMASEQETLRTLDEDLLQTAACRIQDRYRCHYFRNMLLARKAEATAKRNLALIEEANHAAATAIQSAFAGHLGRRNAAEKRRCRQENAALRIQRSGRGFIQRCLDGIRLNHNKKSAAQLFVRVIRGAQIRNHCGNVRKSKAGTMLHNVVKGFRVRRQMAKTKTLFIRNTRIQLMVSRWARRMTSLQHADRNAACILRQHQAKTTIVAVVRGFVHRHALGSWAIVAVASVLRLQRAFQRYMSRKRVMNRVAARFRAAQKMSTIRRTDVNTTGAKKGGPAFSIASYDKFGHVAFMTQALKSSETAGREKIVKDEASHYMALMDFYQQRFSASGIPRIKSPLALAIVKSSPRPTTSHQGVVKVSPALHFSRRAADDLRARLPLASTKKSKPITPRSHALATRINTENTTTNPNSNFLPPIPAGKKKLLITSLDGVPESEQMRMWEQEVQEILDMFSSLGISNEDIDDEDVDTSPLARVKMILEAMMNNTEERSPWFGLKRKEKSWWRGVALHLQGLMHKLEGRDTDAIRLWRASLRNTQGTDYGVKTQIEMSEALRRMGAIPNALIIANTATTEAVGLQDDILTGYALLALYRAQKSSSAADRVLARDTRERALRMTTMSLGANHPLTEKIRAEP
eukprot:PhF_6_TR17102/c0_g1_i2/m.26319